MVGGSGTSILLGNGFSQAWNPEIFSYENLLERADFGDRSDALRALFERFETFDFERVMHHLIAAAAVVETYGGSQDFVGRLKQDMDVLREALLSAIANSHPDVPSKVNDEQFVAVRTFLARFGAIFSVNYDLLMYWARNKDDLPPNDYSTDDGFRRTLWKGYGTEQQVFFLHGALHIFDTGTAILKHRYTEQGATILDQVKENLAENRFPLFVSEPDHKKKRAKIHQNEYLAYCFRALSELSSVLFVFGHSFAETDKHISDAVRRSSVSRVFVSVFGDEESEQNSMTMANARTYLQTKNREVLFFDADSAPVWAMP
jgi:hypothetical protein